MWLGLILRIVSEEKDCYMPVIGGCGALNLLLWCLKRSARLSSVNGSVTTQACIGSVRDGLKQQLRFKPSSIIWSGLLLCCLSVIQNQQPHWNLSVLYDTKQPGPASIGSIVQSLFTAAGGSAIYSLALASNNGADSTSCILLFPSLWEHHSEFQAVNCGWYMKSFSGPGSSSAVTTVVCMYLALAFFFFFNNLTSFIFSQCEITTALVEPMARTGRGKRAKRAEDSLSHGNQRKKYINLRLMFFKGVSTSAKSSKDEHF